jgi:hypothetical protein
VIRALEQRHASGGDCTREVHSLTFQGENPRFGLNWFCLAMSLLKVFVLRVRTFFWMKSYDL